MGKQAEKLPDPAKVAERIRLVRTRNRLNQAEMAKRLDVSPTTISRIERGDTEPSYSLLVAVHVKFEVAMDWLLLGTGPEAELDKTHPSAQAIWDRMQSLEKIICMMSEGKWTEDAQRVAEDVFGDAYKRGNIGSQLPLFHIEGDAPIEYFEELPRRRSGRYCGRPPGLPDPEAFACELHGDSMMPLFEAGHILVFSPAADPESGDYACVRLDDTTTFRRVFMPDPDQVRLVALNPHYPELRIPRRDVRRLFRLVWRLSQF